MTLGRLAAVDISAGINTLVYTVPAKSVRISATVNICNRNNTDVAIRLALVDGVLVDLADEDWIEHDVIIRAGGLMERSGIEMNVGQSIIAYSSKSNVGFQVWA